MGLGNFVKFCFCWCFLLEFNNFMDCCSCFLLFVDYFDMVWVLELERFEKILELLKLLMEKFVILMDIMVVRVW